MVAFSSYLTSATVLAGVISQSWASPIEERQAGNYFVITGVTTGGNAPRREIRDLANSGLQWQLYLQGWERFQNAEQSLKASFYGIGGIHGNPIRSWDGVSGSGNAGYCPHSSNIFGPWHRPYLGLVEQRLNYYARLVANEYPAGSQRDAANAAVDTLRLPYWDWASRNSPVLPSVVTTQTISVTRPNGQQQSIPNPLYSYRFHPVSASDFGNFQPFSYWSETKRAPTSTAQNAQSNNAAVESGLRNNVASYRSRVYNLFTRTGQSYQLTSNHGSGSQGDTWESLHDNIHGSMGNNAHMLYLSFSAFDPIFYLHHVNVDRQLAIWQKLYPSTYVTAARQQGGTYTIPAGTTIDGNSNLTPFHRDASGNFWTSNQVRETSSLHYTYPELADNPSDATLRSRINSLYGPAAAGVSRNIASQLVSKKRGLGKLDLSKIKLDTSRDDTLQQYIVSVGAPLNGLDGPYTTTIFLGDVPANAASWPTSSSNCGQHTVLGSMTGVNNMVYGQIILTNALLQKAHDGDIEDLDEDTVVAYIKDNLHWRVSQNGKEVPDSQVPDIDVQLLSNEVKPRTGPSAFPTFVDTHIRHGFLNASMGGLDGRAPC